MPAAAGIPKAVLDNQLELWAAVHQLPIHDATIDICRAPGRDSAWLIMNRRVAASLDPNGLARW
jgi:hypothetical protein